MKTPIATKPDILNCRSIKQIIFVLACVWMCMFSIQTTHVAADDEVPFFAGGNGAPNVMFVFDNSDSMQDIAYTRKDGRPVRPGTDPNSVNNSSNQEWPWARGVKTYTEGGQAYVLENASGVVQYDEYAFRSDAVMSIPRQDPLNIPGTDPASLKSNVDPNDPQTSKTLKIQLLPTLPPLPPAPVVERERLSISTNGTSRLYVADFSSFMHDPMLSLADNFNKYYKNRLVSLKDKNNLEQIRTIAGYSDGGTAITRYLYIDTDTNAGGAFAAYSNTLTPYKFTIFTSQASTGRTVGSVYDDSLDWTSSILDDDTTFNKNLLNRVVIVKDKNGTEQRVSITGRTKGSKYFSVSPNIDYTSNATKGYPFTYTILQGDPGQATRKDTSSKKYVYDANVDWDTIDDTWKGKLLTITSMTPNETRTIAGIDKTNKIWTLGTDLPAICPLGATYQIKDAPANTKRIYDSSLKVGGLDAWAISGNSLNDNTLFNKNYLYRRVNVVSSLEDTPQIRTITLRKPSEKYWEIDNNPLAGGDIVYDQYDPVDPTKALTYTYTIMDDNPGQVTRVTPLNLNYLTDANVDWDTVNSEFDAKWKNRTLVLTGLNVDDTPHIITGRNVAEKRWEVSPSFTTEKPLTLDSTYKIIGSPDDARLAFGGNHPASKLYQAKQALRLFLENEALFNCLKVDANGKCDDKEYRINMGFATYLSARVPRVMAKYYRKIKGVEGRPEISHLEPVPDRICGYYKATADASTAYFWHPTSANTFTASASPPTSTNVDEKWISAPSGSTSWSANTLYTGVKVGDVVDRRYKIGKCDEQTIQYTVTNIDPDPGVDGSLPNQHKFTLKSRVGKPNESGYWYIANKTCMNASSCSGVTSINSKTLITSTEPCYKACEFTAGYDKKVIDQSYIATTYDHYVPEYREFYGNFNIEDTGVPPTKPYYVDRSTNLVVPPAGFSGTSTTVKSNPDPEAGDWTLVTTTLVQYPTNSTNPAIKTDIEPNIFDTSYFMNPGEGTVDRPHGWSYKKTKGTKDTDKWIYGVGGSWSGTEFPKVGSAAYSNPGFPSPALGWQPTTWKDADQQKLTATPPIVNFPAIIGDEMSNTAGDDQVIFVNLPPYDGTDLKHFGDDLKGNNLNKIHDKYIDITRIPNPDKRSAKNATYDYTIMPYNTKSLAPNAYSAVKVDGQWSGTPLAATLNNLQTYYKSYFATDDMTKGGCRQNFVILLTDGLESAGGDPETAADLLFKNTIDKKGDGTELISAPIRTFVIGFGLDPASKIRLDAIAAKGGTTHAYIATDVESLLDILIEDVLGSIDAGVYSRSDPVVTDKDTGVGLFSAYFDYPQWKGHLKGYNLNDEGDIIGPIDGWTGDCDGLSGADGDAGCEMALHGRASKIYTSYPSEGKYLKILFDPDTTATTLMPSINPGNIDFNGDGKVDVIDTATVMEYTLDSGYDSSKYSGGRDPDWPLGDIYHSFPVVVGPPSTKQPAAPATGPDPYAGYDDFKTDNASREGRIYVGANDGMVHAFKLSNGQEDWAYIPNGVHGLLNKFKDGHQATVDLPMVAADIFSFGGSDTIWTTPVLAGDKKGWHTILASGLRNGGNSYFALDVTLASEPKVAWEFKDSDLIPATRDMGNTWSTPSFGRILKDGVYTYVIFVGGGLSSLSNTGNNVYIIDAGSGKKLMEFEVGNEFNDVPARITVIRDTDPKSKYYGNIIKAYVADTKGDLWRLYDLNSDGGGGDPWIPKIFGFNSLPLPAPKNPVAPGQLRVFHKVAVSMSEGGCEVTLDDGLTYTIQPKTTFIFYGTGDETNPTSKGTYDSMFAVADPPLVPVVVESPPTPERSLVWEVVFAAGEKMLTVPFVQLDSLIFNTYNPEGGCGKGESWKWEVAKPKCGVGMPVIIAKEYLGVGITTSIVSGGPVGFLFGGDIDLDGDGKPDQPPDKPKKTELPTTNKLEYWREAF